MYDQIDEPPDVAVFREWFKSLGGYIHDSVYFLKDETGMSVHTRHNLSTNRLIISCPFDLVITEDFARNALSGIFSMEENTLTSLSERQVVCAYVSMHWIHPGPTSDLHVTFEKYIKHKPYVAILPRPSALLTPLFFNEAELALFQGTNIYPATLKQTQDWKEEWAGLKRVLSNSPLPNLVEEITWEFYLTAATYLTSRAFPSTLISKTPSLVATPLSYPVLIPGVDSLNHRRAQSVTWSVDKITAPDQPRGLGTDLEDDGLTLTLVISDAQPAGAELFNNYGPKPNASLVLAYGFALPDNPDDTILLSVGSSDASPGQKKLHEIGKDSRGMEELWEDVRGRLADGQRRDEEEGVDEETKARNITAREIELDLRTIAVLGEMLEDRMQKIPEIPDNSETSPPTEVRHAVYVMWQHYVKGQLDVLAGFGKWLVEKDIDAEKRAEEAGISIEDEVDS